MRDNVHDLMPLIVDALMDGAAVTKREVAVATLGQVVQSTGYALLFYYFGICIYFAVVLCTYGSIFKLTTLRKCGT